MRVLLADLLPRRWWLLGCCLLLACEDPAPPSVRVTGAEPQGFRLQPQPDGVDIALIRFYREQPDTIHYEFRRHPGPGQLPWPVQRVVTLSATQVGMLCLAGARESIVAVDDKRYIYDAALRARIKAGEVKQIGETGQLDLEQLLQLQPDLVLVSGFPEGLSRDLQRLPALGIPIFPVAEWQESHPLARGAWVQVVAALLDRQSEVETRWQGITQRYDSLRSLVAEETRPLVLTGSPFQGIWSVPAGQSFLATLIRDAGGRSPWEVEPGTGSLNLDPERVYARGMKADLWLNPGTLQTMEALRATYPRFQQFPAVTKGEVYNCYRRARADGANAYWESGAVRPDLLLHDFIAMLHPEVVPVDSLYFYAALE